MSENLSSKYSISSLLQLAATTFVGVTETDSEVWAGRSTSVEVQSETTFLPFLEKSTSAEEL